MIVKLSSYGIKDAIEKVGFIKDNINLASTEIIEDLVKEGMKFASGYNATAPYTGTEPSKIIGKLTQNKNKAYIAMTGPNAVYDEFGTGEEGASNPHPLKGNFGLNAYNSGPFVSTHINRYGRHYWFHRTPDNPYYNINNNHNKNSSGKQKDTGYTEGVPSGKQMYNTSKYIREIKDDVIKHKIQEALQRYKD